MSRPKQLKLATLSERGIDKGLHDGRFNALADELYQDFDSFWWKEIRTFENLLHEKFSADAVFVSDNVPHAKRFGIEILEVANVDHVIEFLLSYLETTHPDASVVVADVFQAPMPASRLVIQLDGCTLEQDALAWFLDRSLVEKVTLLDAHKLRESLSRVNVSKALPWLHDRVGTSVPSSEFWAMIYSGKGFVPMSNKSGQDWHEYKFGGKIVSRMRECATCWEVVEKDEFYISNCLPARHTIKIECSHRVFSEELFDRVVEELSAIDQTWGVRFSLFEDLNTSDSYVGGVLVAPKGELVLEGR
jgi:hypothetical protein